MIEGGVIVSEMGKNKFGGERLFYRRELKFLFMFRRLYVKVLYKVLIFFIEVLNDYICMVMGELNICFYFFFKYIYYRFLIFVEVLI